MTETLLIHASPEVVWATLTDLEGRVRCSDRLKEMSVLGGGRLGLGSRLRIRVDRSRFRVTVTEFRPPLRLVQGARNPLLTHSHTYEISAVSGGRTALSLTGALGGPLGRVMALFSKNRMRRDLRDELTPIKKAAEAPLG